MEEKDLPFISLRCITYARTHMLNEALNGFLKLDYPKDKCELVIVNDYPLQKLEFDHPQVKIYNLDKTFDILGDKENFTVEKCKGEIVGILDDDDVCLPNHLRNIVKYFKEDTAILHWKNGIYYNTPSITKLMFIGNSGIVFSKSAWKKVGGYPKMNAGYDMKFIEDLHTLNKTVFADPPDDEVSFYYMWAGRGYHCSGQGTDTPNRKNIVDRHTEYIEQQRKLGKIPTGKIKLVPNWKQDYVQLLKDYNNNNKK